MKKGKSILMTLILLVLLGTNPAGVVKGAPDGVEVPPDCGVVFDQVDFTFPGLSVPLPDSDWGRVTVYPDILAECTGMRSGYLNVFTADVGWVVANLAIDLADGIAPVTTYFTLFYDGYPNDVTTLFASVWFHPDPLEVVMVNASNEFSVGDWEWNAQGAGDEDVTEVGPPPPPYDGVVGSPPDESHVLPNPVNIQAARNQCFPMSVANSLQFLEETYNIVVPHDHIPGQDGDNTLVGQLDDLANRNVTDRCNGSGVWFVPMLEGKFDYLDANGLNDELIHKHQGQGYGGSPGTNELNDGDFQHAGIVSREEGNTVTWEWISKQIQNGEDVELVYKHATGGHAVRVFGCGITADEKWVRYLHDATQAHGDPCSQGDDVGLEIVQQNVSDLDNDGTLNLGSASREIMFALSESTEHCTDTPEYDQEKIAQVPIPWQFWATELVNESPTIYNIIDRIRISPTWLEPPLGQPAGEGPIFVNRQFAVLEPWMGDKIPLEELVWDFANDAPGPDIPGPAGWVAVSGDPVEIAVGEDLVLEIPIQPAMDPSSAVLVAYEVITGSEDGPVVGHFINEAVTWWGVAPGYEPTIVEILVNFDIHNNTGRPVTNFELDFEGLYFGCEDVVEAIGFVAAQGMPPVPVPPQTWGANADYPLVIRPIDGGTEVKWIQRDRPLEHCEWLHVGLVFKLDAMIEGIDATVQGYWTLIAEAPPPEGEPPTPGDAVGGDVFPVNKVALLMPWIALGLAIIAGGVFLIRHRVHS